MLYSRKLSLKNKHQSKPDLERRGLQLPSVLDLLGVVQKMEEEAKERIVLEGKNLFL